MLFIVKIVLCDHRIFACYTNSLMMLQKLPRRFRTADAHPAFAEAQIHDLIEFTSFFQNNIFACDTDICRTVFNICRHINSFGNNEAYLGFLVADNQLARILGNVFGALAYLRQQAYRLIEQLALRQCYSNVFVHKNTPLYFPAISLMRLMFFC